MEIRPYIFKFGGTSLQTAERIKEVVRIIANYEGPLVVVTSALAGVTNKLVEATTNPASAPDISRQLFKHHMKIAGELGLSDKGLEKFEDYLEATLGDVSISRTAADVRRGELVLSVGERLSTELVARLLMETGRKSKFIDSRDIVRTDSNWGSARVDMNATGALVERTLEKPLMDKIVPVVTGFLGSTAGGDTTTIGRNGSDLTASVLGACLDAPEVWIWTDVDGICTADPRHHKNAKILAEISFREASEAAYFGASVLHPHTLWPLLDTEVAVRIKNTMNPAHEGTLVCANPKKRGANLITTSIENVAVITVSGYGMAGIPGVAATIFTAVRDVSTNILMISQSSAEHNITFIVNADEVSKTVKSLEVALAEWIRRDHRIDRIKVVSDVAVVSVVGENMRGRHGIAGKVFSALGNKGINVIAIAQGSSEYSISAVLMMADMRQAIEAIHSELDTNK